MSLAPQDLFTPAGLSALRAELPGLDRGIYLNTGTLGPSPRRVTRRLFDLYQSWQEAGPGNPQIYMGNFERTDEARVRIAAFFGIGSADLALTGNSTDGINLVANGIQWKPGDEVVISDQEHEAGTLIWLHLRQTKGIRIRIARLSAGTAAGAGPSRIVEEVESHITPRTRLVALSHVTCMTGLRLPAREICRMSHAHGVPVLLDGAQAAGQFPLRLPDLDVDFYAVNGHKWLLGPVGTGALYVSPSALAELIPDRVGGGSTTDFLYAEDGYLSFPPVAKRFEFGTRCQPLWQAWPEALAFLEEVGLEVIRRRELDLSDRLRRGLATIDGVTLLGPGPSAGAEEKSGLVAFRLAGYEGRTLYETLGQRFDVIARPVPELGATRLSTAFFNSEEEVDEALRAVNVLAGEVAA